MDLVGRLLDALERLHDVVAVVACQRASSASTSAPSRRQKNIKGKKKVIRRTSAEQRRATVRAPAVAAFGRDGCGGGQEHGGELLMVCRASHAASVTVCECELTRAICMAILASSRVYIERLRGGKPGFLIHLLFP